jgi:hypothetical protein
MTSTSPASDSPIEQPARRSAWLLALCSVAVGAVLSLWLAWKQTQVAWPVSFWNRVCFLFMPYLILMNLALWTYSPRAARYVVVAALAVLAGASLLLISGAPYSLVDVSWLFRVVQFQLYTVVLAALAVIGLSAWWYHNR